MSIFIDSIDHNIRLVSVFINQNYPTINECFPTHLIVKDDIKSELIL